MVSISQTLSTEQHRRLERRARASAGGFDPQVRVLTAGGRRCKLRRAGGIPRKKVNIAVAPTSALLAKLSRPRLFQVLNRERLFAALDAARDQPAVWITGPPGAG